MMDVVQSIHRCVICFEGSLSWNSSKAQCSRCKTSYPIRSGVLDTLIKPSDAAIQELQGMALEAGLPTEKWEEIKLREVQSVRGFDEKLRSTREHPNDYYSQTLMHFQQALAFIRGRKIGYALEIGASSDFHFLRYFVETGAECHAANLQFEIPKSGEPGPVHRVLSDMNLLPFHSGSFDVVLLSAVSHHSPALEKTFAEIERVLKPGGVALCLSDQIRGLFKRPHEGATSRNPLIHENYYSFGEYRRQFRKNGFTCHLLFSDFYDRKLLDAEIAPNQRFALTAKVASRFWRIPAIRTFLKKRIVLAHILFGFPLNAVLIKPEVPR